MAEFLTTSGITTQLENMIKGTGTGRLLLINPYLKFARRVQDLIPFHPDCAVNASYKLCIVIPAKARIQ